MFKFVVWTVLSVIAGYLIGKKNAAKFAATESKIKDLIDTVK